MIRTIILTLYFFLIILNNSIYSQDLTNILKQDFNRQEQLFIRNEIRKKIGSRANQKDVQELVVDLLPWAKMEGMSANSFTRTIYLFTRNIDSGISLNDSEDLIPSLIQFKGSDDDFLYISKFFQEANVSKLPYEVRDSFIKSTKEKKWSGLSIWIGGRLLIYGMGENIDYKNHYHMVLKTLPKNISLSSEDESRELFYKILKNFQIETKEKISNELISELKSTGKKSGIELTNNFSKRKKDIDNSILELGEMDLKSRPKIELSPEDMGLEIVNFPPIQSPNNNMNSIPERPSDWKTLNAKNLDIAVSGWIGTKYVFGAGSKKGTDCSGFTIGVLTDPLISVPRKELPRSARDQGTIGKFVSRDSVQEGDLVFFSASKNQTKITHVGLSLGNGKFSHASSTRGVVIQGLNEKWWVDRFVTSRRIFSKIVK